MPQPRALVSCRAMQLPAIVASSWYLPQILFLESTPRFLEISGLGQAPILLQITMMCYSCLWSSCLLDVRVGRRGEVRGSEEQPHGGSTRSSKGVRRCVPTKSRGSWGKPLRLTVCWKRVRRGGWGVGSLAKFSDSKAKRHREYIFSLLKRKDAELVLKMQISEPFKNPWKLGYKRNICLIG